MDIRKIVKKFAKNYEIYIYKARVVNVYAESDKFKNAKRDYIEGVGIRVFDKCIGYSYTNSLDEEDIALAARTAAKIAKITEEKYKIPENLGKKEVKRFSTSDFYIEDAIYHLIEMMNSAREANPLVRIDSASFTATIGNREIITPQESLSEKFSIFSYDIVGMEVRDNIAGSFNWEVGGTSDYRNINTVDIGRQLGESLIGTSSAIKIDGFSGDAIFSPISFYKIFIGSIIQNVNGLNIISGNSILKDKIGEELFDGINIQDDPLIDYGLSSYSFDREGAVPKRKYIVEKGILNTYLHNTKTSFLLNTETTGNAAGGFRTPPFVGTGNIIVNGNEDSLKNMISDVKKGILINRFSGNIKINGDFSGAIKCSFLIENGEITHPIKEVQIAGNIFSLLKDNVVLSKEKKNLGGSQLPYASVKNIRIIS